MKKFLDKNTANHHATCTLSKFSFLDAFPGLCTPFDKCSITLVWTLFILPGESSLAEGRPFVLGDKFSSLPTKYTFVLTGCAVITGSSGDEPGNGRMNGMMSQ